MSATESTTSETDETTVSRTGAFDDILGSEPADPDHVAHEARDREQAERFKQVRKYGMRAD